LLTAITEVIGPDATVVVPTQTANNSMTSRAFLAATEGMDEAQVAAFVADMPGFDSSSTPSYGMGAFAEHVRKQPGAVRSDHPQVSFAALGPEAHRLMAVHDLDCHLGERSPLAALYEADASVLLFGVGYESCTALHLAEYRLPKPPPLRSYRCFVNHGGRRRQLHFQAPQTDARDFDRIGAALDETDVVQRGEVGGSAARVVPVRRAVCFAIRWMQVRRRAAARYERLPRS